MSGIPAQIGLTSTVSRNEISLSELAQVAGALQRQMVEDLQPAWTHAAATVVPVGDPSEIPFGYWPIIVSDEIDAPGAAGYHTDANGQPYAVVEYASDWSVTVSHEALEMAADPYGYRLYRAPSPDPRDAQPHPVQILLELCDPPEAYTYHINDVPVSDFVLHQYGNGRTGPYDHLGLITSARQVLDGGYLSWMELDGTWKQLLNFGDAPEVVTLGKREAGDKRSLREWVAAMGHSE